MYSGPCHTPCSLRKCYVARSTGWRKSWLGTSAGSHCAQGSSVVLRMRNKIQGVDIQYVPCFHLDTTEGEELAAERHARDDTPPNLAHSHLQVVVIADVTTRQRDVIGAGRRNRCAVEELKTTDALQPAVGDSDARRELTQTGDAEKQRSVRRPEHHTH